LINLDYVSAEFIAPEKHEDCIAEQLITLIENNNGAFVPVTNKLIESDFDLRLRLFFSWIIFIQLIDELLQLLKIVHVCRAEGEVHWLCLSFKKGCPPSRCRSGPPCLPTLV